MQVSATVICEAHVHNEVITKYIHTMRGTQSPAAYHAWALLCAAGACANRRVYLERGAIITHPNLFVILTGDAGARKTTSINFLHTLTKMVPCVNLAPSSTAGHIQGLISALRFADLEVQDNEGSGLHGEPKREMNFLDPTTINDMLDGVGSSAPTRQGDMHTLWILRGELQTLFSSKASEIPAFLCDLYDNPVDYKYRLKEKMIRIPEPCVNLLGGATPTNIAKMFPDDALEQGIASRTIFVYGEQVGDNYWPEPIPDEAFVYFQQIMLWISEQEGTMGFTQEFRDTINEFCGKDADIEDVRFTSYKKRRHLHIVKLAMCCCLLRQSMTLTVEDMEDADQLLCEAEKDMPEALGEFGMTNDAIARRRVAMILRESTEPLTWSILASRAGHDVSVKDLAAALLDLTKYGKIKSTKGRDEDGKATTAWVWKRKRGNALVEELPVDYKLSYPVTSADAAGERAIKAKVADMVNEEQVTASKKPPRGSGGVAQTGAAALLAGLIAGGKG